jgi:DNA mismatch repair protein MutS2
LQQYKTDSGNISAALGKLEFNAVVKRISELTISEPGSKGALEIYPLDSREVIESELLKVTEAKELLISEGNIPLEGFRNIESTLKKSSIENNVFTVVELLEVAKIMRISRSMKAFLSKKQSQCTNICSYCNRLLVDRLIEHHINESLDERGFVKDNASRQLREIRSSIIEIREALTKKLKSILGKVSERELLQEDIITTRDGRQVIPVKTEYKHLVPGFIHSTSSSGATVFIEPTESLDLNNRLREVQLSEQREIHRILTELTKQVATIKDALAESYDSLISLDVIFAKGRYSIEIIGNPANISDLPYIKLHNARHPVLLHHMKREVVIPLDIELGNDVRTIVITGPNAGGKTVAMKTVGLLILCTVAGIHIPADPDSSVFPFSKVFVDIGDNQSIENDLSTFSSHLIYIRQILQDADDRSLVLIDEIGAGTDPSEGGALAIAFLKELMDRKSVTIATTHHGMLKVFAHEAPGISNASMEYDHKSLQSTYRFKCGVPGSSYAFELAERLGISSKVLEYAKTKIGDDKAKLESLIMELEDQTQRYRIQLRESAAEKTKLESLVASYEQKMAQLKRDLGVIRKKATEEAKDIVSHAQRKIEQSIKEIKESGAKKETIRTSRQIIKQLRNELQESDAENGTADSEDEVISVGDVVKIRGGQQKGEVIGIQGNKALILSGSTRLNIKLTNLTKEVIPNMEGAVHTDHVKPPEAVNQIDLRGMMGDEAIALVQNFLDNAYAAGFHRVDIIHGKGSGRLRKKINEFVKEYPHVKAFRLGEWNEGGAGVTVVEFD